MVHAPGMDSGEKEKFLLSALTCCADYSWLPSIPSELTLWQSCPTPSLSLSMIHHTGLGPCLDPG